MHDTGLRLFRWRAAHRHELGPVRSGKLEESAAPLLRPHRAQRLGRANVLPGAVQPPAGGIKPGAPPGKGPSVPMPRPMPGWMSGNGFTITRLHARYTKESLGEDLVFRAAPPIEGGREFMTRAPDAKPDDLGTLERGSKPSQYGQNNFQGRYAIRHAWTGPIACEHPQRGRWGGPPAGVTGTSSPTPALKLAFAKREPAKLASFLRTDATELGITAAGAPVSPANPGAAVVDASAPAPAPSATPSVTPETPAKGGCAACSTGPTSSGEIAFGVGAVALLGALMRRSRKGDAR